jgi:LPS sulfotransferase NodH
MRARAVATARQLRRFLFERLPGPMPLVEPVFIIGCGRSGTTVLGELLGRHPALAYLHEPRQIWSIEPRTDIWSAEAGDRGGRLRLGADDARPETAARIARAFAAEVRIQGAARLVEKLPINSFRVGFIDGLLPDARFVHLIRNGLEVARSIARVAEHGAWFGHGDYKWRLLVAEAEAAGLGRLCDSHQLRGLLEWRLSITAARAALAELPERRRLELRYEELTGAPEATCARLEAFIGLPPDPAMRAFAATQLARRAPAAAPPSPAAAARAIAGDLLAELGYLDAATPELQA